MSAAYRTPVRHRTDQAVEGDPALSDAIPGIANYRGRIRPHGCDYCWQPAGTSAQQRGPYANLVWLPLQGVAAAAQVLLDARPVHQSNHGGWPA